VSTVDHAERRAGLGRLSRRNRATAHPGGGSTRWGLAILIVVVSGYVQTQESNFLTEANLQTIILNVSSLLIAAAAMMRLVVAGNVDLSIGGQLSLLSVLGALVARDTGSAVLAVAVALGVGALVGLINGVAVRLLSISPLIVTLGLSFVYFGLAYAFSDSLASIRGAAGLVGLDVTGSGRGGPRAWRGQDCSAGLPSFSTFGSGRACAAGGWVRQPVVGRWRGRRLLARARAIGSPRASARVGA
jgi:ribose/xylose/arabinose/galactoside ABC-type transport system permease subunit